jgi:hypothetical protein
MTAQSYKVTSHSSWEEADVSFLETLSLILRKPKGTLEKKIWLKFETGTSEKRRIAMLNIKALENERAMTLARARAQRRVAVIYAIRLLCQFLAYKQDFLYFTFLVIKHL